MFMSACKKIGLPAILLVCTIIAVKGQDNGKDAPAVQDEAKLFSKEAVEKANALAVKIREKHQRILRIDTVEKGPAPAEAAKWAAERFDPAKNDGIYIVISTQPKIFEVVVGNKTHKSFSVADRDEIKSILKKNLKDKRDDALIKTAEFVLKAFDENSPQPKLVKDDAKLFSADAIKQANEVVGSIKRKHRLDFFVETLEEGKDASESAKWANERAEKAGVDGIYLMITTMPKRFEIVVGKNAKKHYTVKDRDELRDTLIKYLPKDRDEALLKAVQETQSALDRKKDEK
jgi:uncharacterized membrane protein YgcG